MSTHAASSTSRLAGRRRSSLTEADLLATKLAVTNLIKAIARSGLPTSEAAVDASVAKRSVIAAALAATTPTPTAPVASMSAEPTGASMVAHPTTIKKSGLTSTLQRLRRGSFRKSLESPVAADSGLPLPASPRFSSPFNASSRCRAPSLPADALIALSLDAELGEDYYPPAEEAHGRPRLFRSAGSEPLIPAHHLPTLPLSLKHRRKAAPLQVDEDVPSPLPSVTESVPSSSNLFATAFAFAAHDQTTPGSSRGTSAVSSAWSSPRAQSFALAGGVRHQQSLCPTEKETKRRPPPLLLHNEAAKPEVNLPLVVSDRFEDTFPPEGQVKKITPQLQEWQKELTVATPPPRPSSANTPTLFTVPPAGSLPATHLRMRSRAGSLALISESPRSRTLLPGDFGPSADARETRRMSMFSAAPQDHKRKSLRKPIVTSAVSSPIM